MAYTPKAHAKFVDRMKSTVAGHAAGSNKVGEKAAFMRTVLEWAHMGVLPMPTNKNEAMPGKWLVELWSANSSKLRESTIRNQSSEYNTLIRAGIIVGTELYDVVQKRLDQIPRGERTKYNFVNLVFSAARLTKEKGRLPRKVELDKLFVLPTTAKARTQADLVATAINRLKALEDGLAGAISELEGLRKAIGEG